MKIIGAEGHDPQTIRDQVARGARFVIYQYTVSVLVMTFKRSSSIHFIRPGHSRLARGAPFSILTLVVGWWGFPWGPIYTVQTLVNNFSGGIDVTNKILATLPVAAGNSGSEPPPLEPLAQHHPSAAKKVLIGSTLIAGLALLVIFSICAFKKYRLPVELVSGAPAPYTFQLNGTSYTLRPNEAIRLTLPEGEYTLTGGPAGVTSSPQSFHLSLPFFDHLSDDRVAIINPDRAAIIFLDTTAYYKEGTTPPTNEKFDYAFYVNQASYFLPKADYFFESFPQTMSMPEGTERVTKTRYELLREGTPDMRAELVLKHNNYAGLKQYLGTMAALHPDDEVVLRTAFVMLKLEDCRALFTQHLTDRPIHVEWHRYYQEFMQRRFPDFDLIKQYRDFLAADSKSGALAYLVGRLVADPAERRQLDQQALAAPQPCYNAFGSLGFDGLIHGDYASALSCFQQEQQKGIVSDSLTNDLHQCEFGLHNYAGMLAEAMALREKQPANLAALSDEITLRLISGQDRKESDQLAQDFLTRLDRAKQTSPAERADIAAFLAATEAYALGDSLTFAIQAAKIDTPSLHYEAAISRGDYAAAATIIKSFPEGTPTAMPWLICYITAKLGHADAPTADAYYANAKEAMVKDSHEMQLLAARLQKSSAPFTPEEMDNLEFDPDDKRAVLTAFSFYWPDSRTALLQKARLYDVNPVFPHLLIKQASNP